MVVGILNTFADLARATTLFFSVWRSIDCTPNAICGCWSIKRSCEFCGVRTSSLGFDMGGLRKIVAVTRSHKDGSTEPLPRCADTSPGATLNFDERHFERPEGKNLLRAGATE